MSSLSPATKIKRVGTRSGEINAIRRWWRQRCPVQGGWDIFHLHDSRLWTLCTSRKFHVTVWRSDNIVICRRFESPSSYISPPASLCSSAGVIRMSTASVVVEKDKRHGKLKMLRQNCTIVQVCRRFGTVSYLQRIINSRPYRARYLVERLLIF